MVSIGKIMCNDRLNLSNNLQKQYYTFYRFSSSIHKKDDYYEIVKNYKETLENNENDVNTLNDLATIYFGHNCFIEAIPLYNKIIQLDPTYSPAYTHLARIYLE